MYNQPPSTTKVQVSLGQILLIVSTIMVSLVLPIQLIELSKQEASSPYTVSAVNEESRYSEGRVAGASTFQDTDESIPAQINKFIEEQQLTGLMAFGGFLLITGTGLLVYLFVTRPKNEYLLEPAPDFYNS